MDQLQSGLPRMNEWIAKTEAQVAEADRAADAARRQLTEMAKAKAKALVISKAQSYAEGQLRSLKLLRARVEAMRDAGLTRGDRRKWLDKMKTLEDLAKKTDELVEEAASAGPGAVDHMMDLKKQIEKNAVGFNEFASWLDTSGIGSTAAKELSKAIHPVFGPIVVEGLQIATEAGIVAAGGLLSAAEADQAARNLNDMKNARSVVRAKIDSQMEILGRPPCTPTTQVATQDSPKPIADPDMAGAPPDNTENVGGGSSAGTAVALIGGAVGTGLAVGYYQKMKEGETGKSCGAQPSLVFSGGRPTDTSLNRLREWCSCNGWGMGQGAQGFGCLK